MPKLKLRTKVLQDNSTLRLYPYGSENWQFTAFFSLVDGYYYINIPEWYRATVEEAQDYIDYLKFCTSWIKKVQRKYKTAQSIKQKDRVD